jgi:hypothetical protein
VKRFAGPLLVGGLVGLHWAAAAIFAVIVSAPLLAALAFSKTAPAHTGRRLNETRGDPLEQ